MWKQLLFFHLQIRHLQSKIRRPIRHFHVLHFWFFFFNLWWNMIVDKLKETKKLLVCIPLTMLFISSCSSWFFVYYFHYIDLTLLGKGTPNYNQLYWFYLILCALKVDLVFYLKLTKKVHPALYCFSSRWQLPDSPIKIPWLTFFGNLFAWVKTNKWKKKSTFIFTSHLCKLR